ncbi:glucuronate isomerase [Aquimarina addita]|uniref:Uronate isomerase n=1 Tax=Aquimarina addita TaxID=870485 RepID=A0ABP7XGU3_9FLAO
MTNSTFLNEDFLLQNTFSKTLFHEYAKDLPIIDYHNHLSPKDIADNRAFRNISEVWLQGDHYKWRAMRTLGVNEQFITGRASDKDKFLKWAATVPYTVRNPLFHWSHLELQRYFGIDALLSPKNAEEIYHQTQGLLKQPEYKTRGLLKMMKVESACTTDDPIDDLGFHKSLMRNEKQLKVLPTFRPDKAFAVENNVSYLAYLDQLSAVSNIEIKSYNDLLAALENRVDYFHECGGRLSDHGLEQLYYFDQGQFNIATLFEKIRNNKPLVKQEINFFKFTTLQFLSRCYHKRGWVQQFHLGSIRNNNKRLLTQLGPDTGFDSIGDYTQAEALSGYLNQLDATDQLAKTIIYNLNPSQNEVFATMTGNFNDGNIKGKVQYGAAWWFLDQKDGMEKHLNTLSSLGMLSCFVGMLTDSRSFLSFPRHEYFRRILCNLIGNDVEKGELPNDEKWLGKIVSDICYFNAKEYFDF